MSRTDFIKNNFLNIQLTRDTFDGYVVRTAILSAIKQHAHLFNGILLDVGCGQMPYREMILESNKTVTRYVGLDLFSSAVHDTSIADLHWDGETIPLAESSVDSVMATEVLEHCFDPQKTLTEIRRIMKPGSTFFFTVPFLWPLHETPYDAYRFTPFSLRKHLEDSGFTCIEIFSLGGWHASLAQMLGLWAKESKLQGIKKKLAAFLVRKLIPPLLKNDIKDNSFGHHCMMTGLYGTAVKK